ncbi:MAG: General secretion pathway protein E [Candidatus Ozemobacter sibiricus]|uniref:General secretion pathway protein E n=1 Tax=Candidatus Ozemobacter sibiricus TaxID=2268124 RepID=A0A367ZQS3_9BACT|nr:MAG: General secretion pathway protein E [Candidatus Ozemobacter sibiricus]
MAICGTPLSMPEPPNPRLTDARAGRGLRLPFEVLPADWLRWPGRCRAPGFRLTADALTVLDGGAARSIPLADVADVHLDGGCLQVVLRSGDRWELAPGPHPEDALALVARVVTEYRQWETWRAAPLSPAATLEAIDRLADSLAEPWVRATELLLALAVGSGASDLHLEPLPGRTRVTLRGAGGLTEAGSFRAEAHAGVIARLKHLAGCHPHLTGIPQEGAWTIDAAAGIEARLAVFPSLDGERAAVRLVRPLQFPDLEALGWPAAAVAAWRRLLAEGPGLLLLTGPVGSGKTTALYATLAELATQPGGEGSGRQAASPAPAGAGHPVGDLGISGPPGPGLSNAPVGAWPPGGGRARRRVVTLEDPVEGRVPGICQASLDPRAGLDLAGAFKHLLRQDPDVMALGEIRDPDCLRQVLQAGLAGHLVLATFHAASPAAALDRLRQMGAAPDLLASGLRGLVGLRWATAGAGASTAAAAPSSSRPRPAVSVVRLDPAAPAGALRLHPMTDPPEVSA